MPRDAAPPDRPRRSAGAARRVRRGVPRPRHAAHRQPRRRVGSPAAARLPGVRDQEHDARRRRRPGRRRRRRRARAVYPGGTADAGRASSRSPTAATGSAGARGRRADERARCARRCCSPTAASCRRPAPTRSRAGADGRRRARRRAGDPRRRRARAGGLSHDDARRGTTRSRSRARSTACRAPRPASASRALVIVSRRRTPPMRCPRPPGRRRAATRSCSRAATRSPARPFAALQAHRRPRIYVLGPPTRSARASSAALRSVGRVTRIAGADPVSSALAFARFRDGLVRLGRSSIPATASCSPTRSRTLDAAAAAPLSASGTYGPLLLVDDADDAAAPARALTCSTSSPATRAIRCAPSTITAG